VAGNLTYRTNNTLIANFAVNSDNELTANTNGGKLTVMGTTTSAATNVTVNGTNALRYNDATFATTNMPLTTTYTAIAGDSYGRHSTNTVTVNIATNTTYQYDGNGNLTNDGLRSFAYDNENQLIQVWVTNQWFSQFSYDAKMRRRIRQEYTWQSGAWVQTNAVYYVYDGNVVIQERNINNLPSTTYTRGLDLSSSLEGAGGIGGLLSMTLNFEPGTLNSNSYFYHADGSGNVTMLLNPSQYIVAKYLYDAFGNTLSAAGMLAEANLYRFSSKEAHSTSGLIYYLYRYYDANLQRWPNRDPITEEGFESLQDLSGIKIPVGAFRVSGDSINLYQFVQNQPTLYYDSVGLEMTGPGTPACAKAMANYAIAYKIATNSPTQNNIQNANQALQDAIKACTKPKPPAPPKQPVCPYQNPWSWNPNNWYIPPTPQQQQCTVVTGGTIIIIFCIPWPGNPVFGGL